MCAKSQHAGRYRRIPILLRTLREDADLTQRELGKQLSRPQSWVYNCETANRRVDISEFIDWAIACGVDPIDAFQKFLDER